MALRPAKFSRVSLNEDATAEAFVFPQSGPADIGLDAPLVPVPLYRGLAELQDSVLGKSSGQGAVPSNLDVRFSPRFWTVLFGRSAYSVTALGTGFYRHRWGLGEPLLSNLQMDSLSPSTLTHIVDEVYPSGFSITGAAVGGVTYNPSFVATGKELTAQIDATPTEEPFAALSSLNGQIVLNGVVLGAVVTGFSLEFSNDIQSVDPYFFPYQTLIGAGDMSIGGQLNILYENEDFYNMAVNESKPAIECLYGNLPMASNPTQWVRFIVGAARLSKGLPRYGGKGALSNDQRFAGVPTDASGLAGIGGEILSKIGPFNITATDVDLHFKIDGGSTITKTLTTGGARTAAQIVTDIGSFTGGTADVYAGRVRIRSNTKGAASSVQLVNAGANSAHDAMDFDLVARAGSASPLVVEVVNTIAAAY